MTAQISEQLIFEGQKVPLLTNPLNDYFSLGPDGQSKFPHPWPPQIPPGSAARL